MNKDLYPVLRSSRRRTIAVVVDPRKGVYVRAPHHVPLESIQRFLEERRSWIEEKQRQLIDRAKVVDPGEGKDEVFWREKAFSLLRQRVDHYAAVLAIPSPRFSLGAPRSRWGSCNARGFIRFNWRIVMLPEHLMDYVVVHELCHLIHLDHSQRFWDQVRKIIPDYALRNRELRAFVPYKIRTA